MISTLGKITKVSIYLLVFLMPLFFLPQTPSVLTYNKQVLLVSLTFIALFSWLLDSLTKGKINLNISKLNIPIVVFLIVAGISTWFSSYRYASFWGWPLDISSSLLTTICFALLYFLIINVFEKKDIIGILFWLAISGFLAAVIGGLQMFGRFIFPFDFTKTTSFNTIDTIGSLGIFLGILSPLFLTLFFISKRLIKFLMGLFSLMSLLMLVVINFWVAWVVLLIASIVVLVFGISEREIFKTSWLTLPVIFLVLSVFFGFFRVGIPGLPTTPLEISPSHLATFNIAKSVLRQSPVWGSGPGTFAYNYSQYKPESINQTLFWAVRFSAGSSEILNRLIDTGILGLLSFLAILVGFLIVMIKRIAPKKSEKDPEAKEKQFYDWVLTLGILAGWIGVVASMFLYPTTISVMFSFWVFNAVFVVLAENKIKTWNLEPSSMAAISVSFLFILIFILSMGLFFVGGQRYLSELKYQAGIKAWQNGNNAEAINQILGATTYVSGQQDDYWRDLAQIYLVRVAEEVEKGTLDEQESQAIAVLAGNAINSAKNATDVAPKNVANWTVRGFIYRQLINVIEGSGQWSLTAYQKAAELEPSNPYIYTEIGRVYTAQKETDKAKEQFDKALSLKSDYAPARFQIALAYVNDNKISEAITEMENAKKLSPFDTGVAFQLGLLYYNNDQMTKAKQEFNRVIAQNENYSNARYFLGLILDKEGKKNEAIVQFEKIQALNPDNEHVQKVLENLRAGKKALTGLTQEGVPIEEKPAEVLK